MTHPFGKRSQSPERRKPAEPASAKNPAILQPTPTTAEEARERAIEWVGKALETWTHALQMMSSLDRNFATHLIACQTAAEAIDVCNDWMKHRVDSLSATKFQLTEIWLEYTAAVLAQNLTKEATPPSMEE